MGYTLLYGSLYPIQEADNQGRDCFHLIQVEQSPFLSGKH